MFLHGSIFLKVLLVSGVLNLYASISDPQWAAPINTALLIALTYIAGRNGRKLNDTNSKVDKAAEAAASAAIAAESSARISKDIGSTLRVTRTPENE